tara:strand:- start:3984 stop:5207 length:1224 start_codon:yes stop_codon:yes gene_type:complete
MKILFITDNFPPEVNAPASRTFEHVSNWSSDSSVEIIVITCFPNFPKGKVFDGYKNKFYESSYINNIRVIRVWSYISRNQGTFRRILDYLSFAVSSSIVGLFIKCDIIVATSPQFFTTWAAWFLSKLKRVPWIFELRDLWPDTISAVSNIKNSFIISLLHKIEINLYRSADSIIALTHSFKENLISRGIDRKKISVITNGVDLKFFKEEKNPQLIDRLGIKDKFIIGYIGTHGLCQGLQFIIELIPRIKRDDIHFLFVGEGATKKDLINKAKKLQIRNITFLDMIKKKNVPQYLSICHITLVPLINDPLFKTVIPSKIFESAAIKRPILLGVKGESEAIIKKYNAGICYEPENQDSFMTSFNSLLDYSNYSNYQKGCTKLANDFNREILAKKMLTIIKETYKQRQNL